MELISNVLKTPFPHQGIINTNYGNDLQKFDENSTFTPRKTSLYTLCSLELPVLSIPTRCYVAES
jgi:hypothetical protein